MHRISRKGHEPIVDVDHIEAIEPANRAGKVGRYCGDELTAAPMPSDYTCHRWGVGITKQRTGIADPDQSYLCLSNERRYNRIPAPSGISIRAGTFWQMV